MYLKNKLRRYAKWLMNRFMGMPVTIKVTLYYTLFLTILLVILMAGAFRAIHIYEHRTAVATLTKVVHEAAQEPWDFDVYEKNVYLSVHSDDESIVMGAEPAAFPKVPKTFDKGPQALDTGTTQFHYLDMPIRPELLEQWKDRERKRAAKGKKTDLPESILAEKFRPGDRPEKRRKGMLWIRGVMESGAYSDRYKVMIVGFIILLPLFVLLVAAGGYRIIRHAFAPVASMSQTARDIGETGDLSKRISIGPGRDEIHQMVHTLNNMLDQISELVEKERRFTSDVSHELRTPIAIVMAESEYGKDYTESVDEAKKELGRIFDQSRHMSRMINQLLELSRLGNKRTVSLEDMDISSVVQSIMDDYQMLPESKKLTWQVDIQKGLSVKADRHLFSRVFVNYLDNAMKFTHSRIQISLQRIKDKVVLSVTDDGEGMDEETLKKIWDRLYQADSSRSRKNNSGMGLGLSFVAIAAKLMKAKAYAKSEVHKGSTFYLEFNV
jgi:signal transduction histidine kinase